MRLVIKPTSTDSVIELKYNLFGDFHNDLCFRITRNISGTDVLVVPASSYTLGVLGVGIHDQNITSTPCLHPISWYDEPNTTSAVTYKLWLGASQTGSGFTAHLNRSGNSNTNYHESGVSTAAAIEYPKTARPLDTENALTIPPFVGATNKEKLYNQDGDLYFNGKQLSNEWHKNGGDLYRLGANVGIGKSNPAYKLDVTGDINFTGNLKQNGKDFGFGGKWSGSSDIYYTSGNVGVGAAAIANARLYVEHDSKDVLRLYKKGSENYGSETSGPSHSSHSPYQPTGTVLSMSSVKDGTSQTNATLINMNAYNSSNGNSSVYLGNVAGDSNGAGNLVFGRRTGSTSFAESMRISKTGNVSIGTTSSKAKLTIHNADSLTNVHNDLNKFSLFFDANNSQKRNGMAWTYYDPFGAHIGITSSDTSANTLELWSTNSRRINLCAPATNETAPWNHPGLTVYQNKVGIGTTSPYAKLQVSSGSTGEVWTTGTTVADCHIVVGGNEWGGTGQNESVKIGLGYFNGTSENIPTYIGSRCISSSGDTTAALVFGTRNSSSATTTTEERMCILPDGNVGIGTTSPDSNVRLQIESNHNDGARLKIKSTNASGGWKAPVIDLCLSGGSSNLIFAHGDPNTSGIWFRPALNKNIIFDFQGTGKVGIGTSSPGEKLDVSGNIKASGSGSFRGGDVNTLRTVGVHLGAHVSEYGHIQIVSNNTSGGWIDFKHTTGGDADREGRIRYGTGTGTSNGMLFETAKTERMRINTSGYVGIGMNSPDAQLCIRGTTSANGTVQIVAASSGKNMDCMALQKGGGSHIIGFRDGTSTMGQIRANGSGGLAYDTSSDERLKENIVDMNSMINKVMSIKCREYDWKESKKHDFGFIAQEIYELFPHLRPDVSCYCDCSDNCFDKDEPVDKDGNPYYYGLDYGEFTPYLIKAFQEQNEIIKTDKAKIQSLEAKVASLESELATIKSHLGL